MCAGLSLRYGTGVCCVISVLLALADPGFNYDESQVAPYSLPDPLRLESGSRVADITTWRRRRRELIRLFEEHVYGRGPGRPPKMRFHTTSITKHALRGLATRKQVSILFTGAANGPRMDLLIYVPNVPTGPVPAFLGLNFQGNHAVHADPEITLSRAWMRTGKPGVVNNRATEASRAAESGRWPVELILQRGYALVTAYYGDLDPDFDDGFVNGVHPLSYRPGQTRPAPDEWGALAAWSWGLVRAMDYLATERAIDRERVAVVGHSRLGKAALWAAAQDERMAMAIANESGKGGAALTRRRFGETVKWINANDPHRFCGNYRRYDDAVEALPVDQHMLIALLAPRPVYVASAIEDHWADPRGEFLGAKAAEPVYELFGRKGLGVSSQPPVDTPVGATIGYHVRSGKHDINRYDWEQFLNFADRHLRKSAPSRTRLP